MMILFEFCFVRVFTHPKPLPGGEVSFGNGLARWIPLLGGAWGGYRRSNIYLLLLFPLLFSCEEFAGWRLKPQKDNRLVVEAILTNEPITQEIKLSQTYTIANGQAPPITDARVEVEANGIVYGFEADTANPGTYKSSDAFAVVDHLPYTLSIEWEEMIYTASSELSRVSPMPEIGFRLDSATGNFGLVGLDQIFNPNQQAMYEVWIDWSHLQDSIPNQALVYYYTFSFVHVNELIRPARERILFPPGSQVIVKKYGLNDDFADFLRAMLIETDWSGNLYFVASGDLPGNISNEALGFFTTCAVVSDTLIAE